MADKRDLAKLRVQYAAYRKGLQKSPDTATQVLTFKKWLKQKDKKSE